MVTILPPDLSTTFLVSLLVPVILGFLVGIIIKSAMKIGVAIVIVVIILIAAGIISPSQVLQPLLSVFRSGGELTTKVQQVAGYLPYSSITFLVGLAIGYFKG